MFIWPWALIQLIGRASFLMNFQERKKKKESATSLLRWHFECVIVFRCFSNLMSRGEPNYHQRPSGFIAVTHFQPAGIMIVD